MNKFDFSVILPTHNSELGIEESITSIINQTHNFNTNIEIIIVDNNSKDNTPVICKKYVEEYADNIRYFQLDCVDISKSINLGIKNSLGNFITFLQPHDYYSKDAFKNVLNFINKNKDVDLI